MKFISWNVNGIKSCIKNGSFEKVLNEQDADFFCIQEIRTNQKVDLLFDKYKQFWNCSASKSGYSGTAIFCKKEPINVKYGIQDEYGEELDDEGRILTLEYSDFYLVNCYTPNSQLNTKRLNYRLEFDEFFRNYVKKLNNNKNVVICGDFNIAYQKLDVCKEYRNGRENIGFSNEEKEAFSELLNCGFLDTFRYFHPQIQKYTWWFHNDTDRKNNIGWRLDYFLISEELRKQIRKAEIHTEITGSDHCPIELELEV
jgi:exodeoxyribonuclease-3